MRKLGRFIYNILPYYIVKKLVFRWTGDGGFRIKPCNSTAEWTAIGREIDYGEWLMIADREALLKERKLIEGHLRRNQERLDELKRRGA